MKHKLMDIDLRFQKIIENNYSGITLLNADFGIIFRSPSAERITGWSTEKRAQNPTISIVHPEDQEAVIIVLEKVLSSPGLSLKCTFRSMHYDGHFIWLENTYTNMLDEDDVHAIVCNFRDVTEQRATVQALTKQTEQISELLETMTDSFIALDENLCYTYANKQVARLLGRTAESLIGQHIWTLFPEAVGSATYQAIRTAYTEKIYVCNEDFYAPLQLWQENRVYPSAGGVSVFIRNISKQKKEQHHLKLLESVITNTTDAILITEAEPFDEPGPRILYVNEAFSKMTGYSAEEIVGNSPRILQGPKTDVQELRRLGVAMRKWQPCELTVLNYKKNGEEFWINFTVNPVADDKGWFTHWISIDRDVTERKNEELQKALLAEISQAFNQSGTLLNSLHKLLYKLVAFGGYKLAEVWLVDDDKNAVTLVAKDSSSDLANLFYQICEDVKSFVKGEGLPGTVWATKDVTLWNQLEDHADFLRRDAAKIAGLKSAYGLPLIADDLVIGVLILAWDGRQKPDTNMVTLFETFSSYFGGEIRRKQLDIEKMKLESLLNKVTDLARIGGWEIDLNTNSLYWSKITREIHEVNADFKPDITGGISFYENSADRLLVTREINSAIENGTSFDFELPIVTANLNKKWVRVVGEPEFCQGKCVRIYGSFQDVDARVKAEQRASEVAADRDTILESIGDAFFAVDKNWTVKYWNNMAEQVLSRSKDEIIDQNLWVVFSDAVGSESFRQYHHVMETGLPAHFEDYYPLLDKWYEISAYPSGNGLSVYFKDVTDRKFTQQLLQESEKKYSELFQLSPLPKWVFDLKTLMFLDVNKAAIDHYGYSREEFSGMTIKDIRPLDQIPLLLSDLDHHKSQPQLAVPTIFNHQKKNGQLILVDVQSNDIQYRGNKARIVIANDITDSINYIKAIEIQNEKLKEISWMQSHIIRAPVSRIMGLIPLLEGKLNSTELKQIIEYIKISAIEIDQVIHDINDKTSIVTYPPHQ